jgi:hypothetical protein
MFRQFQISMDFVGCRRNKHQGHDRDLKEMEE